MVVATAADPKLLRYSSTFSSNNRPGNKFISSTKFSIHILYCFSSSRAKGYFPIRVLDPQRQEEEDNSNILNATTDFNAQNDLEYLGKLLAGSIVGGTTIKYGSIAFPKITRPNILLALIMIFTPVIIATLLLIKQSHAKG